MCVSVGEFDWIQRVGLRLSEDGPSRAGTGRRHEVVERLQVETPDIIE